MLVLSRFCDESIIVGDDPNRVRVTVIAIQGDKVRLGFQAPPGVAVDREEVRKSKERIGAGK